MVASWKGEMRRKRTEWSEAENKIFFDGIQKQLSVKDIADLLYIRTPEDVRLHLRWYNTMRAHHDPPLPPIRLPRVNRRRIPCVASSPPADQSASSTSTQETTTSASDDSSTAIEGSSSNSDSTCNYSYSTSCNE